MYWVMQAWVCTRAWDGSSHGRGDRRIYTAAKKSERSVAMKRGGRVWSWFWMVLGILYFSSRWSQPLFLAAGKKRRFELLLINSFSMTAGL